jgi:hypothetical protein
MPAPPINKNLTNRIWARRAVDLVVFTLGTAAVVAMLLWLHSVKQWWSEELSIYVVGLLLVGGAIGAYAGWAFDEIDDPVEERRLGVRIVLLWLLLPMVFVLGRHVLLVPFDMAPGTWPWWADVFARVLVSIPTVAMAIGLSILLARKATAGWTKGGAAFWAAGTMFLLSLIVIAAWPWLGAPFPVSWRVALLLALLTGAVLCAKRIDRDDRGGSVPETRGC